MFVLDAKQPFVYYESLKIKSYESAHPVLEANVWEEVQDVDNLRYKKRQFLLVYQQIHQKWRCAGSYLKLSQGGWQPCPGYIQDETIHLIWKQAEEHPSVRLFLLIQ